MRRFGLLGLRAFQLNSSYKHKKGMQNTKIMHKGILKSSQLSGHITFIYEQWERSKVVHAATVSEILT